MELESVLFGRKSFAVGTEAEALWIRPPKVDSAAYTVHTRNGSVILAESVALTPDGVEINQPPLRRHRIPLADLVQLRCGNAADVVTEAWNRIDQAKPEEKAVLLASVANVGRMLDLRAQVARQQPALKLAQAKMDLWIKNEGTFGQPTTLPGARTLSCGRGGPSATAIIFAINQSPARKPINYAKNRPLSAACRLRWIVGQDR